MDTTARRVLTLTLVVGAIATLAIYGMFVDHVRISGIDDRALTYLVLGWIPYGLTWYAIGRRFGSPGRVPSMRPVDIGVMLVIIALLVSIVFDLWGFSPTRVPLGHIVQAVAVFAGLALFGWGIGRRSARLDRLEEAERS